MGLFVCETEAAYKTSRIIRIFEDMAFKTYYIFKYSKFRF